MIKKIKMGAWGLFHLASCLYATVGQMPGSLLQRLSMDRAVDIACKHRPDVRALKELEESYQRQAAVAKGGFFPTADISTDVSKWRSHRQPTINVGLAFKQPLFVPNIYHNYKAARHDAERQRLMTEAALLDIRHAVEVDFLKSWQLQQQGIAIQKLRVATEAALDEAKAKHQQELVDRAEVMKNIADYTSDQATVHNYADDLALQQCRLSFLLGYDIELARKHKNAVELVWTNKSEVLLEDMQWYIKQAMKNHPALKEIRKRIDVERERVRSLQLMALPTINLVAGVGTQSQDVYDDTYHFFSDSSPYYNIGINVGCNIFDGLINRNRERAAQARLTSECYNYDQRFNEVKSAVETAFFTLSKAMKTMQAGATQYAYKQQQFEQKKCEYNIGEISTVDYKKAVYAWEKARFEWLSLSVDAAIKERDLLYACGYPSTKTKIIPEVV